VLASSPSGYAGHTAAAVRDLRSAAERVLVAGRASELGDQADLVDGEVHDGMDVAAFLSELLDHLGAPPEPAGPTDDPDATAPKEGRR
jgi:methylmalonyl-CoA mutase